MPSSLIKDHKSKKVCPNCNAHQLFTNDPEKAADKMSIYYQCLNCNGQFFEHPGQKKSKDVQEKTGSRDANNLSLTSGIAVVFLLFAIILLVNVVRQNDRERGVFQPAGQSEVRN